MLGIVCTNRRPSYARNERPPQGLSMALGNSASAVSKSKINVRLSVRHKWLISSLALTRAEPGSNRPVRAHGAS